MMNRPIKVYGFKDSPSPAEDISLQDTLEALQEKWMIYNLNVELAITEGKRIIHSREHR